MGGLSLTIAAPLADNKEAPRSLFLPAARSLPVFVRVGFIF